MSTPDRATHRRRRMLSAADGAVAWARSLTLQNPHAKNVLKSLVIYINDDCSCFPSLETLAQDTDLSQDTVRSRLRWLESIGVIAQFPQWRDENGRVNTDGRGKRTTNLIRLLIDADPDAIEARAAGRFDEAEDIEGVSDSDISPCPQQGLNSDDNPVSPRPALGQPSDSGKGLISEREREDSPPDPPPGDVPSHGAGEEPKHFAPFRLDYPDRELWNWPTVLPIFAAMPEADQAWARAAAPLYARQLGKKLKPMRPERFLRNRIFANYEGATLPPEPPQRVFIGEADGQCLRVLGRIVDRMPTVIDDREQGRGFIRPAPIAPDLAALAQFAGTDVLDWEVVQPDTREFKAWRARLHEWTGQWIEARPVRRRGVSIKQLPSGPVEMQASVKGIPVPTRWPPKKDGSIYDQQAGGDADV